MSTSISSFASSFPGHEWTPFPNGINVLGFGATSNMTPMMLSAICSSVSPSFSSMNEPNKSLCSFAVSLRRARILARI
ncbi:hypothetical protein Hanom_Chr00s000001g01593261 [Helianthus anomalus]